MGMKRTYTEFMDDMRKVRRFIHENPGKTKDEIYSSTGVDGVLNQLLKRRSIRHAVENGKTVYYVLQMGVPAVNEQRFLNRLPHPDEVLYGDE